MAVKPVKVLTDLLTKKQILKQDLDGNVLFRISGSLNNGVVSSSLPITSSAGLFDNLNTVTTIPFDNISIITNSSGLYNVDQAFHAIDVALKSEENQAADGYKRLRYKQVGFFNEDGSAQITLPKMQLGGPAFPASSIDYVNLSVMVRDGNAWTNDLLSINLMIDGPNNDEVCILLDAPALSSADQYKLLAVNENPDDYLL